MVLFVMLMTLVTEYGTSSTLNAHSARNARDGMTAHFLNRSAANLAQLIIRVQTDVLDRNRKLLGDIQLADYTKWFIGAFGGSADEVEGISQMLGGFDADAVKGLGVASGEFDLQITTEDGKLNLNCANGSQATRKNLKTQLEALFYFDAFDPIFENEDAEGWRRTRAEQVDALLAYVNKEQPASENRFDYQSLEDRYLAKNNYLDSVGEIKLVKGVDDRFWTLFGSEFTVYGGCKVNIGAVKDPKLIASLIFLAAKNPEDPVLRDPQKLWRLAQRVAMARSLEMYFDDLDAFANYVKDPDGTLQEQLAGASGQPSMSGVAAAAQELEPVQGVELDKGKLGQVARSGPRRIYRVEVNSTVGVTRTGEPRLHRKLVGIWDTQVQNQNMRNPANGRGAWVFWREE